jgi:hypothetical protein
MNLVKEPYCVLMRLAISPEGGSPPPFFTGARFVQKMLSFFQKIFFFLFISCENFI